MFKLFDVLGKASNGVVAGVLALADSDCLVLRRFNEVAAPLGAVDYESMEVMEPDVVSVLQEPILATPSQDSVMNLHRPHVSCLDGILGVPWAMLPVPVEEKFLEAPQSKASSKNREKQSGLRAPFKSKFQGLYDQSKCVRKQKRRNKVIRN